MKQFAILLAVLCTLVISCTNTDSETSKSNDIIIENEQMKLIIGSNGIAKSLLYKPTNEECLVLGENVPVFTVTQERPYNNEIKLAHPNKRTIFFADSVAWDGDNLIVGFEIISYEAIIKVKVTPDYITFKLEGFIVDEDDRDGLYSPPPVSELCILQLPVRNRTHFGEWLNVSWDDNLAVNILATDQYSRIDSERRNGYRILKADAVNEVKLKGVEAALIVSETKDLLDKIAKIEDDYNLPKGVQSRKDDRLKLSYYWSTNINPQNVDRHLEYAKMAGFRHMLLHPRSFLKGEDNLFGNYDYDLEKCPNGKEDLEKLLAKIEGQGIISGVHFLHSFIFRGSRLVTPVPDHRLNLLRYFTLAKPLGKTDTEIYIEQNPEGITMVDGTKGARALKIGGELISFEEYTTTPPYMFTGCKRGVNKTIINTQPVGYIFGLLDGYRTDFAYIDQNTSLQDEIAEVLADIYDAGFKFIYFDGSEGVNEPFWFHVASAQYKVFRRLNPQPIFSEGASKTHFSWHMISGGNAFDIFRPEVLKEEIRRHPAEEAPRMQEDFTRINFGWLGYWVPDENTVGTQPDMLEFVTSRAAAWDCPVSLQADLNAFDAHPRTADNLEVFRRWEEVRVQNWLTEEQKKMLQNLQQEHILLVNEQNNFELVPYEQITEAANGSKDIRAFIFERQNDLYVTYWHISGSKKLVLPLNATDIKLYKNLGREENSDSVQGNSVTVPLENRLYLKASNVSKQQLIDAFAKAIITD